MHATLNRGNQRQHRLGLRCLRFPLSNAQRREIRLLSGQELKLDGATYPVRARSVVVLQKERA
jgi:hypothetical protein